MVKQFIDENRRTVDSLNPKVSKDLLLSGTTAFEGIGSPQVVRVNAYETTKIMIGSPLTVAQTLVSGVSLSANTCDYFWIGQGQQLLAAGSVNVTYFN